MTSLRHLHPAWVRAALLGSVWASVEIVLGSFLHNIRLPMAGTILAGVGVCLIVAGSRIWDMDGVIWRAGVICALMKSVSPSAVILGPMVGIVLEACVLEAATRIFGRNAFGYLLGGAVATALPILQKIIGLLFLYGVDAARLYVALYEFAAKTLHISSFGAVDLVLLLLSFTFLLGILAASVGIFAGRRAAMLPPGSSRLTGPSQSAPGLPAADQRTSLPLLAAHAIVLPAGLFAVTTLPTWLSALATAGYVTLSLYRYPRVRGKFFQARLWIEFAIVSVLAGLLLGELTDRHPGWSWEGLTVGLQMALRATLVITAFSSISVELRNPVVLRWFFDRGLGQLSRALEAAFEALPTMIRALGEERKFFRHPLDSVARLLATARDSSAGITLAPSVRGEPAIILLTGARGSGKTRFVLSLAESLRRDRLGFTGVASVCIMDQCSRTGYDLQVLQTGQQAPLCRIDAPDRGICAGPFMFFPEAFSLGEQSLGLDSGATAADITIVDEVGPLELDGKGWAPSLQRLLHGTTRILLLTVRPALVTRFMSEWNLRPAAIWEVGSIDSATALNAIRELTRRTGSPSPIGARGSRPDS